MGGFHSSRGRCLLTLGSEPGYPPGIRELEATSLVNTKDHTAPDSFPDSTVNVADVVILCLPIVVPMAPITQVCRISEMNSICPSGTASNLEGFFSMRTSRAEILISVPGQQIFAFAGTHRQPELSGKILGRSTLVFREMVCPCFGNGWSINEIHLIRMMG